jgi:nitrite reductase/ring-hydroxylating ferredoxin subunit
MNETRRGFLGRLAALLAGGAAAGMSLEACASAGPAVYRYAATGNILDLFLGWYPELNTTSGAVELLLTGTEKSVLIVRTGIDRFVAISPVCGADGCKVELRKNSFRCPCDGSVYGLDGAVQKGPSQTPLVSYRTEFRETSLRIFLG